jgi:hypothetical protein
MPAPDRDRILARRREEQELQQRAQAILEAECQVQGNGEDHR